MTKIQKIHTLGSSRIEQYYNKIVAGFVILTAALVVLILYFSFSKTTITVKAKEVPQKFSIDTTVKDLSGTLLLTEASGSATSTAIQSTEKKQGKAKGIVTIKNSYTKDQPLAATTRLLSKNGVLFRTDEFVTVPAGGSVDVAVTADQEGASGDVGPTTFEIVALWSGLKEQIYGTSSKAMSGGVVSVGVVTQEDITAVEELARENLLTKAQELFQADIAKRDGLPKNQFTPKKGAILSTLSQSVNAKAGDNISSLTATETATVGLAVFDKDALLSFVQSQAATQMPDGFKMNASLTADMFTLTMGSLTIDGTDAAVVIDVEVPSVITTSSAVLSTENLTNKTAAEVSAFLEAYSQIDSVSVNFSPFWVKRTPRLADHITIAVE